MRDIPIPWRRRPKPSPPHDAPPDAPLAPAPVLVIGRSGFIDGPPPAQATPPHP